MEERLIALTHAGGIAAEAILEKLPESGLAPDSLVLLGDENSIGTRLAYADGYLEVQDQHDFDYALCALVLMPEYDADIEAKLASLDTLLVSHTIDNGEPAIYAFGQQADINLSYSISSLRLCNAELACLLGVLPALNEAFKIRQINLTMLRSAEARGKPAIDELAGQAVELLNGRSIDPNVYPLQIAFNMIPAGKDHWLDLDLPQLLGDQDIKCIHQFVDVPVFHGFAAGVQLEFADEVSKQACQAVISEISGVRFTDADTSPITDCNQSFSCVINRLDQASKAGKNIQFWMIADPMRYGLANNYLKVTDFLLKSFL